MASKIEPSDTSIEIVTPENIAFAYRVAGPFRRLPAFLIDVVIQITVGVAGVFALSIALAILGLDSTWAFGVFLIVWAAMAWFFTGVCEAIWNGQTPGKRMMQIRVVTVEGQPINAVQAILRCLLRAIDMQPFGLYLVGLLTASLNDRFQRLGDMAAGTIVVIEESQSVYGRGVVQFMEPEVRRMAERIPANYQASPSLARALAAFAQRRRAFAWGRRQEIARHLGEPLRQQFNLPPDTNADVLLCALYQRTFFSNLGDGLVSEGSPFAEPLATVGVGK